MQAMTSKKKIVIVDDDLDLLKMLSFAFKEEGFSLETFSTGKEALKALTHKGALENISLLILDRMLPDMDGMDIAKALKEKNGSAPPILFLSVLSSEKDILKGLKVGAVDYIAKPFNIDVLLQKAKHLLRK